MVPKKKQENSSVQNLNLNFRNSRLFLGELTQIQQLVWPSQPLSPISIVARPCCASACPCQKRNGTRRFLYNFHNWTNSSNEPIGIEETIVFDGWYLLYQLVQDCIHSSIHRKGGEFLAAQNETGIWGFEFFKPTSGSRHKKCWIYTPSN